MDRRSRSVSSIKKELLLKSKEAALCAIKTFNDPLVTFKSETFIVLMIIAWTYLLHAYYRSKGITYYYYRQCKKIRRFERTKQGSVKHWELERCLNEVTCPLDGETQKNLRFLIGLRHEIEHQMAIGLDNYLSGRYQACAFNFNDYLKKLFGEKQGLDPLLTYSIQFMELDLDQIHRVSAADAIPVNIRAYIEAFDRELTPEEFNSPRFSYRLLFTRKLANRPGQADRVVEFVDPNSELAKTIQREYWVKKEVERPKYLARRVVDEIRKAGFPGFRMFPDHVQMWRSEDGKNPAKGYGVLVEGYWYWYDTWIKRCIELCTIAGQKYK